MKEGPDNIEYLLKIVSYFNEVGGYWNISCHEDSSIEIEWHPFSGEYMRTKYIFQKRVYDCKDFYKELKSQHSAGEGYLIRETK